MINDDFYNIARKMLACVSVKVGEEKIINKGFWGNIGIFRRADKKVYYPTSIEVRASFETLVANKVCKFRNCDHHNIGVTILVKDNVNPSTFSFSTKPNL